ncbi:MAG: AzlC family ABC transporter permease [Desulfovibrionales bacterium]|nr:AzlC family ABC transporter permease [Desulfovibrionales bacterium]
MNSATLPAANRTESPLASAFRQALPIILGYVPVGFAYGVLAQKSGLSGINTVLMSVLVFAGSAQLIAVGLFAAAASPLTIVATTFIVNLRHLLMSAALAPYLRKWSKPQLALFSYEMTDETFALHAGRFAKGETAPLETFGINVIAQSAWVGGTVLGLAASTLITDVKPIGLDYALPAMFIALLLGQLKSRLHLLVAVTAGALSTVLMLAGLSQSHVLAATILAATLGLGAHAWTKRRSS